MRFKSAGIGDSRNRALMGCSLLAMCGALFTVPAMAQQTAQPAAGGDDDGQIVVVHGIRGSLRAAINTKRKAEAVVDSISSEDLGKFPDANVAESLQRVPGVSIDRNEGEGQFVTVRGLGPQFNNVLFNGRTLASDNYGRQFSFDLLAAELISGADVYKTSQAYMPDGGIGATINLHTARPFDQNGLRGVFSAKANYESNSRKTTPQVFGLVSDTFANNTLGLLASVSYQERNATVSSATSDGYLPGQTLGSPGTSLYTAAGTPLYTTAMSPQDIDVNGINDHRTRLGVTVVGQYRPSDDLLVTVDGLYNHFKDEQNESSLGAWFQPSSFTAATLDANGTVTSLTTNGSADQINQSSLRDSSTYEAGVNVAWKPNDKLDVVLDATSSFAGNDGGGKSFFTVIGFPTTYSYVDSTNPKDLPTVIVNGFTNGSVMSPSLSRTHLAQRDGNNVTDRVNEVKLDSDWGSDGGVLADVKMGLDATWRKKEQTSLGTLNVGCLYCGYPTLSDPSLLTVFHVTGLNGNLPTTFYSYDPNAYLAYLSSAASLAALDKADGLAPGTSAANLQSQSAGNGYNAVASPPSWVDEQTYAAYIDANFKGELGGLPWRLNVGGRYVHTNFTAYAQQRALLDILPVTGDPTIYNGVYANNGQYVPVKVTQSYDDFLPDFNLKIDLNKQMVLRVAASQTVTRPDLSDLQPTTSYNVLRPASMQLSGGNPNLLPYKSTNLDLSWEWYPTRTTVVSVAPYYKTVSDFIVTTIQPENVTIANAGHIPVNEVITGPNTATFQASRPRNAGSAEIWGAEFNFVHTFDWLPGWWSGFGTQLNANVVNTNRTYANMSPSVRFAVVGLSDSQNLTIFYEKYGISARVAYNHRDLFLSSISQGYGGSPLYVRPYGQIDASAAYDITPRIQVVFEGTNIGNAKYITTAQYSNQLRGWYNYGSRYDIGVRYKF